MKKYVFIGASGRCLNTYAKAMHKNFKEVAKLVGIYDVNKTRMKYVIDKTSNDMNAYDDFDEMMQKEKPDVAIITTVDAFHHEYIIKTLEYGCDVIVEKPLTIDEVKCKAILDAQKKYNNKITVTFNYRFTPYVTKIREIIKSGAIGKVLNVDFEYFLDRSHGADYYRRWHRYMKNSGGLLLHKSTHHFDLVNWWINETPVEVFANGSLRFYGKNGKKRGIRCKGCENKETCEFYVDYFNNEYFNDFYFKAEYEDGYFRDGCVFDKSIDIYDNMSVGVKYDKGTFLTYSLTTYNPYEGWKASIVGTKGRIEGAEYHSGSEKEKKYYSVKIFDINGNITDVKVNKASGDHGGGDAKLLNMLFNDNIPDPLNHMASVIDGVNSIMIGVCANKSIKNRKIYTIKELL